jgi:hypothetical protein
MKKTFLFAAFAAFTLLVSSCGDAEAEAKRLADSTTAATEATRIADSVAAATEATEATRLADSAAAATEATRIADSVAAAAKKPGKKAKVEAVVPTTTTPTNKIGRKKNGAN